MSQALRAWAYCCASKRRLPSSYATCAAPGPDGYCVSAVSSSRIPAARASVVACADIAGCARVRASAYAAIAWRCETMCQYQPPAASATRTSSASPATIKVRPVGSASFSMPLSYAKSPPILAAAGAAPLPALRRATHEVPAVRAPLVGHPAEDEPDPGRDCHADHESGIHESRASAELDEDVAVLDGDWIAGHPDGGVVGVGAGRDVPAPGVPGTEDDAALEIAFAQRAAAVDAGIVDRVEGAVDVEEGQIFALGLDHPALPDRHVLRRRDPHAPLSHSRPLGAAPSSIPSDFAPSETASQMIVDHAGGLHESVADRR